MFSLCRDFSRYSSWSFSRDYSQSQKPLPNHLGSPWNLSWIFILRCHYEVCHRFLQRFFSGFFENESGDDGESRMEKLCRYSTIGLPRNVSKNSWNFFRGFSNDLSRDFNRFSTAGVFRSFTSRCTFIKRNFYVVYITAY